MWWLILLIPIAWYAYTNYTKIKVAPCNSCPNKNSQSAD